MNTGGALIDTRELDAAMQNVSTPRPVLLDVRWRLGGPPPAELYASGHLPGAVAVDLDRDLAAPVGDGRRGRHPLPEPGVLQEALRRWGITEESSIVAYDDADATSAARAWWLLRWAGLRDVRVLDGGIAAWTSAGLPLATDVPAPEPADVVVRPGAMPVLDATGVAELVASGGVFAGCAGRAAVPGRGRAGRSSRGPHPRCPQCADEWQRRRVRAVPQREAVAGTVRRTRSRAGAAGGGLLRFGRDGGAGGVGAAPGRSAGGVVCRFME